MVFIEEITRRQRIFDLPIKPNFYLKKEKNKL